MSDNLYKRAEEIVEKKIKFYKNLQAYIIVNAFLAIINWFFTPEFWWVLFPVFFWGIGVFKDFLMAFVFVDKFSDNYRERKIQEEMMKLSD
ncbi:2TM domain-containing protein [uncultured Methanobrevibacter sp.]|uniref:2TM domain-containing protein n=1 Tax=uncultured Methanobrevibacter sp. TaxID=253161 RepID=UPI0025DAA5E1|nr:2TM domain-containing protein [uncultured Methanobrevibacter sp.]